ncbi:hypothetical protein C8J56DRAFT_1016470 [Mycena floridula]|nr:hypothetical protein C8J56DRAFT_1176236 [Mycena floridula]KAJ7578443.1 hypothetical protein C8J56DRAFT_1016470 [Mycena floridula]
MEAQLETGICKILHEMSDPNDDIFDQEHTLQVLSTKLIPQTNGTDRYRIIMSDGEHFLQAMLATQLNDMVSSNEITKHSIIVTEKLTMNVVQSKKLLILLSLRVVGVAPDRIGSPVNIQSAPTAGAPDTPIAITPAPPPQHNPPPQQYQQQQPQKQSSSVQQRQPKNDGRHVMPIDALSPYQNTWTIKARVTQKSEIKHWSNPRGEGKLFNVTLMDESGEIRATAFNAVVDALYDKLQEGKVYYVSRAKVNLAKKKFSNLANDYELALEKNAEIEECLETSDLPMVKYHFHDLGQLEALNKDAVCDVIGVVKEVSDLTSITTKATSRQLQKRELTLVDRSQYSVRLTLWGRQAEQFNTDEQNPVIAFKGVKVGDYGGRSLSMIGTSMMAMNPDIDEAHGLRGWYDSSGNTETFHAHARTGGSGGGAGYNRAGALSLKGLKEADVGEEAKYFSAQATIMHIKTDNMAYAACSSPECQKKVIHDGVGWRCEKCNVTHPQPRYRYIMQMAVADWSGQAWFQGFNDTGEAVIGMNADVLMDVKERDQAEFDVIIHRALCKTYNFSLRAKQDSYNDNVRIRYGVTKVQTLDFKEEAQYLLGIVQSPWGQQIVS